MTVKTLSSLIFGLAATLFILTCLAFSTSAQAQTATVAPPIDRGCQPMRGSVNIGGRVATEPQAAKVIADWAAADARHSTAPATTNFFTECRKQYVAKTTPPCPAAPASSVATVTCAAPLVGSYQVTTTYIVDQANCKAMATTTPASAPAGACNPPAPPPAPEPPASGPVTGPVLPVVVNTALMPNVATRQSPVGGYSSIQLRTATTQPVPSDNPAFRSACQTAKFSFDDPIIWPGQPGKSHLHVFFGNTGTDAYTTAASLLATGNTTCRGGTINKSAYWAPAMIDTRTGAPLLPLFETAVYYKALWVLPPTIIKPFPQGLRFIMGNPAGNPSSPSGAVIYACTWDGGGGGNSNWSKTIPSCAVNGFSRLIMAVDAEQCWDGVNLDSPDHRSHMMAAISGGANQTGHCPTSHPVALPMISVQISYEVKVSGETKFWRLSSDNYDVTQPAGYSGHFDYFAAWSPGFVEGFVANCLNKGLDCGSSLLGDGREMLVPVGP
jgi:hypothetical protein